MSIAPTQPKSASSGEDAMYKETVNTFGRGTAAGRLLHNLYTKPSKESTLDRELLEKFRALRQRKDDLLAAQPKPVPKSKVHIDVPRPVPRRHSSAVMRPMPRPGRRTEDAIRHDPKVQQRPEVPVPKGPLITEVDKNKLQRFMEYNGEPPQLPDPRAVRVAPPPRRPRTMRDELVEMFDSVAREIQERKAFLAEVPESKKDTYAHVTLEIADRVKELRRIDKLIKEQPVEEDGE
eukprot:PhM_4_TR5465/c0_g1_i1/m.73357